MQSENFVKSNSNSLSQRWEAKWGSGHLLCTEIAGDSPACWPLITPEAWRWGPPRNWALLGVWPARRSLQAVVDSGWPAWLVLHIHSSTSPCLTAPQGYGLWQLPFTSEPGFDLTSQDPVAVETPQYFGFTVITRTVSQADDSFQPWLTSAFWPSGSVGLQALYPIFNGEPYMITSHKHTHHYSIMKNFFSKTLYRAVFTLVSTGYFEKQIITVLFCFSLN